MPSTKSETICNWKRSGLIYDDYKELYEIYIKTMECQHCNKEFKNSTDRCMDHNHETGRFRKIVCQKCNINDSYIKYPNGYTKEEYRYNNREKIKEQVKISQSKKYNCGCGSVCFTYRKKRHELSLKHIDWWINNID